MRQAISSSRWFIQTRAAAAAFFVSCISLCPASVPDLSHRAAPKEELSPLVDWVIATGVVTVVRSHIARAAGLGEADIRVRERGFHTPGRRYTELCAVATQLGDAVIIGRVDEATGSAIVWRTSRTGRLEAAILFVPPAEPTQVFTSAEHIAEFEKSKRYLAQLMAAKSRLKPSDP